MESTEITMGFLADSGHARALVHAGIANSRFPLKSVAGKTFPAFPVHARPAILGIWLEPHCMYNSLSLQVKGQFKWATHN